MEPSLALKGYIKDCISRFWLEFLFKIAWIKQQQQQQQQAGDACEAHWSFGKKKKKKF